MSFKQQSHIAQTGKIKSADKPENANQLREQHPHPASIAGPAAQKPGALSPQQILQLQTTIGNRAVSSLVSASTTPAASQPGKVEHNKNANESDRLALPAALKASIESLSGISLDDVQVHYNSSEPAQVGALAYTRGTEIHLGSGQEQHLAHEAWHVVQQKQGRVNPTMQLKSAVINDDSKLEHEADSMGERALQMMGKIKAHDKACGCPACLSKQPKNALQARVSIPAAQSSSGMSSAAASLGVIQRKCGICGSPKHSTNNCTQSKEQRDTHKEKVTEFKAAKEKQIQEMQEQEKSGPKKKVPVTEAFSSKHVAQKGVPLEKASKKVAETRDWGERQSGKSTVVDISSEDQQKEARYHMENLKFGEAEVGEKGIAPKYGVVKPTKFDYPTQTSTVSTDKYGKRTVTQEDQKDGKPVIALRGQEIHHLHGVDDDQ